MKIGNVNIKGAASLAPMAGVTDRAFREVCAMFGVACFTSEMVSVKGLNYGNKKTFDLMTSSAVERPFAVQLFGSFPEDFAKAADILSVLKNRPDILDINMGCPAHKITKNGSGSALMQNPKLCGEIVKAVKSNTDLPVTVKMRSGWNEQSLNAVEISKICEDSGASAVTIHGRTKNQMYSGSVNLDIIKKVKNSIKIPVIGNGDVFSAQDAQKMIEYTKCDMIAVGRGCLGNPWIFAEINNNKINFKKLDIIKIYINKICEYKTEQIGIKEAKKNIIWFLRGIYNSAETKNKICNVKNKNELFKLLDDIFK